MPSQHMLPKGKRRQTVRPQYVATRGIEPELDPSVPTLALGLPGETRTVTAPPEARGKRLDLYLAQAIPDISRARVQLLIDHGQVRVNGDRAKPKHKVAPGEQIEIQGTPQPPPLRANPEAIPLTIVHEDADLAVIDKPAGMAVHAGNAPASEPEDADPEHPEGVEHLDDPDAGTTKISKDPRSSGTLVNALLHHFQNHLSSVAGDLRPGIVHRLDKQTSGLIVVAKNDLTHRRLGDMFAAREVRKTYLALVHGHLRLDDTTVKLPIGRDLLRRTRMTTRRPAGAPGVRSALSHIHVLERLHTPFGPFTLVEVTIETGRTHQIRVHLQALGHPVVGDTLYGAPAEIRPLAVSVPNATAARKSRSNRASAAPQPDPAPQPPLSLPRNFLHATRLRFLHPRSRQPLNLEASLPPELVAFLDRIRHTEPAPGEPPPPAPSPASDQPPPVK